MEEKQTWVQQLSRDVEGLRGKIHTLEMHSARLTREAERLQNEIKAAAAGSKGNEPAVKTLWLASPGSPFFPTA